MQGALAASAAGMAVSAGLLAPRMVLADGGAFEAKTLDEALKAMAVTPEESDKIKIKAPEIAENGAVVPVTITADMDGVTELSILVEKNPTPLAATFILGEGAKPEASTRIKMGATSNVIALAKAGDKTYSAKQEVKVTIGGCGG